MRSWLKQHFPFVDKWVDRSGYWQPPLLLLWGGMSWAASSISTLAQFGWGAVVLAGLAVACLAALLISASLALYRYFRPLPLSESLGDHAPRFGVTEEIGGLKTSIADLTATAINLAKDSDQKFTNLEEKLKAEFAAITEQSQAVRDASRRDAERLDERLFALKTVYEMQQLKRDIDRLIVLLDRPLRQAKEDRDWSNWSNRYLKFKRSIDSFAGLAGTFYPKEASNLTWINPNIYRMDNGRFVPENFPDHETSHDFKSFDALSESYRTLGVGFIDRIMSKI